MSETEKQLLFTTLIQILNNQELLLYLALNFKEDELERSRTIAMIETSRKSTQNIKELLLKMTK